MPETLDNQAVVRAYERWAPVYDLVFTAALAPGRAAGVQAAERAARRIGGAVLDVGVGTGLELPRFSHSVPVVGVDLSEPMLQRAAERVARERLTGVQGLAVMDAQHLAFADGAFAAALAPYVMTVVPDPWATLDELARVTRPGGEIVLVNHIGAEEGPRAAVEAWMGRRAERLGWRPEFPWSIIGDWSDASPCVRLVERRSLAPFSLFTLVRLARLDGLYRPASRPAPVRAQ
jgi:phosphatidylethanolamine/phosphatidyl-N-methylethanolamine N-methyltransferase